MKDSLIRVEISCANEAEAKALSAMLIRKRLAACVQAHKIMSRYEWDGEVTQDTEVLLVVKTRKSLFNTVCEAVKSEHSYNTPEIAATDITHVGNDYLAWALGQTALSQ